MLTLTYNDEHLPLGGSVSSRDTDLFNKRLRYYLDYYLKRRVKMYWASEYGTEDFRPHYHYMIFGLDANSPQDMECVHRAWLDSRKEPIGFWDLRPLIPPRIKYVMKYVRKEFSPDWYDELQKRKLAPLFHSQSNGIGFEWFMNNIGQILAHDGCYFIDGVKRPLNRYYKDLFIRVVDDKSLYEKYQPLLDRFADDPSGYRISSSLSKKYPETLFWNLERERLQKHKELLDL